MKEKIEMKYAIISYNTESILEEESLLSTNIHNFQSYNGKQTGIRLALSNFLI